MCKPFLFVFDIYDDEMNEEFINDYIQIMFDQQMIDEDDSLFEISANEIDENVLQNIYLNEGVIIMQSEEDINEIINYIDNY